RSGVHFFWNSARDSGVVVCCQIGMTMPPTSSRATSSRSHSREGRCETLCVHGDGPDALRLLAAARAALVAEGFTILAPERVPAKSAKLN
ncbi:MAG: hypothetical protein H7067_19270, partial [Burkholderiales bacterium]|nr:hypothetical protein [Opitutaceae bacterium]